VFIVQGAHQADRTCRHDGRPHPSSPMLAEGAAEPRSRL